MTELRRGGLLVERKEGRGVFYGLKPQAQLEDLVQALWPHLHSTGLIRQDQLASVAIRSTPVAITCSVWEDFEWFETSKGIVEWAGEDYFRLIIQDFLQGGHGRAGLVGSAQAYLLDGKDLVDHAVAWMEAQFKPGALAINKPGDQQP